MKKFIFIFNTDLDIFIQAKNGGSDINIKFYNYYLELIKPYLEFKPNKNLYKINFELADTIKVKLVIRLKFLLEERKKIPLVSEQSEWKGRFTEKQMFNSKLIFGIEYKLYVGGIDNEIFWLASFVDLIDNSVNNKINLFVYFNNKIIDIDRLKKAIKSLI